MIDDIRPVLIDLSDYEFAGEGANGASYNHRTDPDILLKLYTRGDMTQPLDELLTARKVFAAGIPTPEPGDLVTDGQRVCASAVSAGSVPMPAPSATIPRRSATTPSFSPG